MIKPLPTILKLLLSLVLLDSSIVSRSQCGNNPVPNAVASPVLQTICSGTSITPIVISGNVGGTTFNWTRDNATTVTGIPSSGSGNIGGTLINTTNTPVTVTFTITPTTGLTLTLYESFNQGLPPGWAQQNLSSPVGSSPTWYAGTSFPPYSAPGFIEVNKNSGVPGGPVSNWLFTPEIQIKNRDQYCFYTRSINGMDNLQIRISTNGSSLNAGGTNTSVGDFQYLQFDMNPAGISPYPVNWKFISAPILYLPAGTASGRIAFRYYESNSNYLTGIGIDNFAYYSSTGGNSCIGQPITAQIVVNPNATVNLISNQTLCNSTSTAAVNFSSPISGGTTAYNWTNNNTAIGLAAIGTGNIPSFAATNTGNAPITGTLIVTPAFTNANPFSFVNPNPIVIPASGNASPYPATVMVSGLPVSGVSLLGVRLHDISHMAAGDLDIALKSPMGQTVILMSDVGGQNNIFNSTITLMDGSAFAIPNNVNPIVSGTYTCTNLVGGVEPDVWPAPGPGALNQPTPLLSMFTPNYNGQWSLLVLDQFAGDGGNINGGFELIFGYPATCTGTPTSFTYTVNPSPTVTITSDISPPLLPGQVMTLTANVSPAGGTFVWYKDGVVIPGANNNILTGITVNDLGNYTVVYTDLNGCSNVSAAFNVFAKQANGLFIHPNPSNGRFRVSFFNVANEEVTATVYDPGGRVVTQRKTMTGAGTYAKVEMELPPGYIIGTYMVEVRNSKGMRIGSSIVSIAK